MKRSDGRLLPLTALITMEPMTMTAEMMMKPVAQLVALPAPVLELQGEHWYLTDEKPRVMNIMTTRMSQPCGRLHSQLLRLTMSEPQNRALAGVGRPMKPMV